MTFVIGHKIRLGKKHSEETKKKISETKKRQHIVPKTAFKKGVVPWNKGRKNPWISERNKIMNRQRKRERHWNWKGGITKINKIIREMPEYILWRSRIFERDSWVCQTCRKRGVFLVAHHIKPFSKIIKENKIIDTKTASKCRELWDLENGVTLCNDCHKLVHLKANKK